MKAMSMAAGLVVAAGVAFAGSSASADESGIYLGLTGGVSFPTDTDFAFTGAIGVDQDYDAGFSIQAQIGYQFDDLLAPRTDLRVDLEIGYTEAEVDTHTIAALGGAQAGSFGETSVFTLMTNAYVDYNVTDRLDFFVGGGAGLGFVDFDNHGVPAVGTALSDDAASFVFHLDAGVSFDITENVVIEGRYRYQNAVSADLSSVNGTSSNVTVQQHMLLGGLRLQF